MKRVLIITGANLGRGGVQLMLLRWLDGLRNEDIKFIWYFPGRILDQSFCNQFGKYEIEIISGNCQNQLYKFVKSKQDIDKILKQNSIDIVHINTGSLFMQTIAISCARKNGIKRIIAHSRNTGIERGWLKKKINNLMRTYITKHATDFAACSDNAARWLFEKHIIEEKKYQVIPNPVEFEKCLYNDKVRAEYRQKLGITQDTILLGTVGNLNRQKNTGYILRVLKLLDDARYKLIILGDGREANQLKKYVIDNNLANRVYFMGSSTEVHCWLQAMDIFLMSSKWEGFGNAAIEAEASGLPCVLSDQMCHELNIVPNIFFLPLENPKIWIRKIISLKRGNTQEERKVNGMIMKASIYNFDNAVARIKELYEKVD